MKIEDIKVGAKYKLCSLKDARRMKVRSDPGIVSEMHDAFEEIVTIETKEKNYVWIEGYGTYSFAPEWFELAYEIEVTEQMIKDKPKYNHTLIGSKIKNEKDLLKSRVNTDNGTYLYGLKVID